MAYQTLTICDIDVTTDDVIDTIDYIIPHVTKSFINDRICNFVNCARVKCETCVFNKIEAVLPD